MNLCQQRRVAVTLYAPAIIVCDVCVGVGVTENSSQLKTGVKRVATALPIGC